MIIQYPPLLITSCVSTSAPLTTLSNPTERINLTVKFIGAWLSAFPQLKIVICDGSGFNFSQTLDNLFPTACIEVISFMNDASSVSMYGKGYGEGEIINYALENSRILKESSLFAKVTSKMWVKNFEDCVKIFNGQFLAAPQFQALPSRDKIFLEFIDTRFFISDLKFYLSTLSKAHLRVRDLEGYYLEHSFRDQLLKEKILNFGPPFLLIFEGISGSTGKDFSIASDKRGRRKAAINILIAEETSDYIVHDKFTSDRRNYYDFFFTLFIKYKHFIDKMIYSTIKPNIKSILKKLT